MIIRAHTIPSSTNSTRLWTRAQLDGGANHGPPQTPSLSKSVELWWRARDKAQCTHQHTNTPTSTIRIIKLNNPTLWANVLGIFSLAPAGRRSLDTESGRRSLRSLPRLAPHYKKMCRKDKHIRLRGQKTPREPRKVYATDTPIYSKKKCKLENI